MSYHYESYSRSISNFVHWAQARIEQEIEANERCEKEYGSAEAFKEHARLPYNLSDKEKLSYIKNVEKTYRSDPKITRPEACALNGIHYTTFYKWRIKLKKKGVIK